MSDYILTYTKTKFYPLDPVKGDIKIEDIAHALSLMTRANGHFKHFYSVAQHAVNCYKEAKARGFSERVQLGCLLHDASESYISDLTRPVKKNLSEYFVIEEKLQRIIYEKYGLVDLSEMELEQIKEVDDALLYYEFQSLMEVFIYDNPPKISLTHDFEQRAFVSLEKEFITIFNLLTGNCKEFTSVGIDGCREGWVAVSITGTKFEVGVYKSIDEIINKYSNYHSVLIDMPIGLPESTEDIRPDDAARKLLKRKASSIFNTPCRQAVYVDDYERANEINRDVIGKGLSCQSFAIRKKIKEIDQYLLKNPQQKNKLLESHPELCFTMLNSGEPIYENKKTPEGIENRIKLLSRFYDRTEELFSFARKDYKLKKYQDDVIDALCLAVSALIGLENGFDVIPNKPITDSQGILMQIVYGRNKL